MCNLADLENKQGNHGQARHWYQKAISTGHPRAANQAQHKLGVLDRGETDRQRAEHFGRYGYLAYADPALLKEKPEPAGGPGRDSMETFLDTHGQFPDEDISHDEPS